MSSKNDVDKILEGIDYKFLKGKDWKDMNLPFDELKSLFQKQVKEEIEFDPDAPVEEIIDEAKENLPDVILSMSKGGNARGNGVNFGISFSDFVESKKGFQIWTYKKALKDKDQETLDMLLDPEKPWVRVDKSGRETKITALDNREKKGDNDNKNFGLPYPDHAYKGNFVSRWKCDLDGKMHTTNIWVGGEGMRNDIPNDYIMDPRCPKCGAIGWTVECGRTFTNSEVKKTGGVEVGSHEELVCDGKREYFILPKIMETIGCMMTFPLRITTKDNKIDNVYWSDTTMDTFSNKNRLELKYVKKDGALVLGGSMAKWIPKDSVVKSATINDFHEKAQFDPVFYKCKIYKLSTDLKYGNMEFWCRDYPTKDKKDPGIKVLVPEHVYDYCVAKKIGVLSKVLVVGHPSRKLKKDKDKKRVYKTVTKNGEKVKVLVYEKSQITATAIIPIGKPRPPKEEKSLRPSMFKKKLDTTLRKKKEEKPVYKKVEESETSMSDTEILERIMSVTGYTNTDIGERIKQKIDSSGGELTKIGAMLILADELDVPLDKKSKFNKKVDEDDFDDDLDDIYAGTDTTDTEPDDEGSEFDEDDGWGS